MTLPNAETSSGKSTHSLDPGVDKYLAKIDKRFDAIDVQFDDLRDRFDRMFDDRRRDIAKLRALIQAHIDRMDAESLTFSSTVCRERVGPSDAASPASQSRPCGPASNSHDDVEWRPE